MADLTRVTVVWGGVVGRFIAYRLALPERMLQSPALR